MVVEPPANRDTPLLPERIEGDGLLLRRWRVADAQMQHRAVAESIEHLRPWLAWAAAEAPSLDERRRMLAGWEEQWSHGGDVYLAVVVGDAIAGSAGLHRRLGPGVLEIGYWIHPAFVRRGLATRTVRLLTDAVFSRTDISCVEIHHDKANVASGRIPQRVGYAFVAQTPDVPSAPGEIGIDCTWRMTRDDWAALQ